MIRKTGGTPLYRIETGRGLLASLGNIVRDVAPAYRYAIVTDSNVGPLYGSAVATAIGVAPANILVIPAGEASKTRETWARLTDELISRGFGRDSTIVALGGGVVGDLAGFVAATFMRGVPVVQVPTTLLAMIDASLGGKTGVDTPHGKNLVGAFHRPSAVIADIETLATLPLSALRTGFAEAIKHGVIADRAYFASVVSAIPGMVSSPGEMGDSIRDLVVRGMGIKTGIVELDEREGGLRKVLNFGHTVGHAIETLSGYGISHGEAIAIGMVVEATIAERAGIAEGGTAERIREALLVAGLPMAPPGWMSSDRLLETMGADKKARGGKVEYALPRAIGEMAGSDSGWTVSVDEAIVREVLT